MEHLRLTKTYTRTAIALHWAIALLIFATFPLGLYMTELALSPQKLKLYAYHKWIGVTVFLLAAVRLAWRATHPAPPLPASVPAWQRRASALVHVALYALMLAIPVSGWLMSSAKGVPTVWLGLVRLPDLVGRDDALGETLRLVHMGLNAALFALVLVHVAAALKHHLIDRDEVLQRMLPWRMTRGALPAVTIAIAAALVAGAAGAVEYDRLLADRSRVSFVYRAMGAPVEGRFGRFDAQLAVDPAQPDKSRAVVEIDVASIDTQLPEANDTALTRAFFDAKTHPKARFVVTAVRAIGADRFEVAGELTIKGRTRPVRAPVTIRRDGDRAEFSGTLTIRRLEFAIGEGAWSDTSALADEVEIRFQLVAAASSAAAAAPKKGSPR
jgi:cytochrome b561